MRPERLTLFRSRYGDLDESSMPAAVRQVRLRTAWMWAFRERWRVVELPEPLWLRALPLTMSVGVAVRIGDLLRRRRTVVTTYAMENNDPDRLLPGMPRWVRRLAFGALRIVCDVVYDRMAFASEAAADGYREARVLPARCAVGYFADILPPCTGEARVAKLPCVAFVAALEERKGLSTLVAAWPLSGLAALGWTLLVAGAGPLEEHVAEAARGDPSIVFRGGIDRAAVHALMARATVVVLPSQPEGRWKEQIGLPIVEGLAHGCRVVATPDTGLAHWLADGGHSVLTRGFDSDELAQVLRAACLAGPSPDAVRERLPATAGRASGEKWMYE